MADRAIRLQEGEQVTKTVTVYQDGAVFNLTGYTVTMYVHAEGIAKGTNLVDGEAVTVTDATNGVCTFEFTTTHTDLGSATTLKGRWWLKMTSGSTVRKTRQEPFYVLYDPGTA